MATRFCLSCGGEFIATVEMCPDCEVELVDEQPADHLDAAPGDKGQIEYQLHEWAVESRVMLEQLLKAADIRHAWEGADLIVPAVMETQVDGLVAQVEVTTLPTLDPDLPRVAYDIDDWTDAQQTELMQALEQVGLAYEFDGEGALVVLEEDEERVEAVLDSIEFPDALDVDDEVDPSTDGDDAGADDEDEDGDAEPYDGPEAMDVMSDLFVAADRLFHKATDPEGVLSMVERAADAARMPLPYGFAKAVWKDILTQVDTITGLLESDESDDDAIEEHARVLRDTLRQYV